MRASVIDLQILISTRKMRCVFTPYLFWATVYTFWNGVGAPAGYTQKEGHTWLIFFNNLVRYFRLLCYSAYYR